MDSKPPFRNPRIGVTGPDKGGTAAWIFTATSVMIAGGLPVRITPSNPRTIDGLDGLIIGGGADVDPDTYEKDNFINIYLNQTLKNKRKSFIKRVSSFFSLMLYPAVYFIRIWLSRRPQGHGLDKNRDQLEFNLLDQAVKRQIPVMGICRGSQLINVYFKGTLYKNIKDFYAEKPNRHSIFPVKKAFVREGSKMAGILRVNEIMVNSIHNQAVKKPGVGIDIVAKESNDVVQAIESDQHPFIIGVQWHPEYLVQKKIHRRIFKSLINACRQIPANPQHATESMAEAT
jgi:putative glutamine amidotransferase